MRAQFIIGKEELTEWINEKLAKQTTFVITKNSSIKAVDIYDGISTDSFELVIEI